MIQPVILRELTTLVHRPGFGRERWRIGLLGILLLGMGVFAVQVGGGTVVGPSIFGSLAWILWTSCVLFGSMVTADSLSRERREGTLGLLFLTPLSAWDVVIGKLAGGAANAFYRLLTLTPMLTCSLLLGGTTGLQVLAVVGICLNTLFLALTFGVFVSSTQTDDRASFNLAFFGFIGFALLPYGVAAVFPAVTVSGLAGESPFLLFSPAYPIRTLASQMWIAKFIVWPVTLSALIQHGIAWGLLVATASRCRYVALDQPPSALGALWRRVQRWLLFGSARNRQRHRTRMLNLDPIAWLALRHRRKELYVWVLSGLLAAFTVGLILFEPTAVGVLVFGYCYLFFAIQKSWLVSETCTRLVDDRRSGGMELILTTETSVNGWMRGQILALKRLFLIPTALGVGAVAAAATFVLWDVGEKPEWEILTLVAVMVVLLGMDVPVLFWMCLWEGLRAPSVNRASSRVMGRVLLTPYAVALVGFLAWMLIQVSWSNEVTAPGLFVGLIGWFLINSINDLAWLRFARPQVLSRFQEMVVEGLVVRKAESALPLPTRPRGIRRYLDGFGWVLRRHPFLASGAGVFLALSSFLGLRNAMWDRRVATARAQMWQARVPTNLPPVMPISAVNSPANAELVKELLATAKASRAKDLAYAFDKIRDPFAATNRTTLEVLIQPYQALADRVLQLPTNAVIPWEQGNNLAGIDQVRPFKATSVVLAVQVQQALEAGNSAQAVENLAAIFSTALRVSNLSTYWFDDAYAIISNHAVQSIQRWLNRGGLGLEDRTTLSNLLARADSWEVADRRLRHLPLFLEQALRDPAVLGMGPPVMLVTALDVVTPGSRVDKTVAFQQTRRAVDALEKPEAERLTELAALSEESVNRLVPSFGVQDICKSAFRSYLRQADILGRIRSARAAILVEQFRAAEGRLPRHQQEIVAWKGNPWPSDPLTGRALGYLPTPTGYQIQREPPKISSAGGKANPLFEVNTRR